MELHIVGLDATCVLEKTKWITNSREIAGALDRCRNHDGGPPHQHLHLIGGIAKRAEQRRILLG
eukprot:14459057-Heterocapsa_arctica.AAC.1